MERKSSHIRPYLAFGYLRPRSCYADCVALVYQRKSLSYATIFLNARPICDAFFREESTWELVAFSGVPEPFCAISEITLVSSPRYLAWRFLEQLCGLLESGRLSEHDCLDWDSDFVRAAVSVLLPTQGASKLLTSLVEALQMQHAGLNGNLWLEGEYVPVTSLVTLSTVRSDLVEALLWSGHGKVRRPESWLLLEKKLNSYALLKRVGFMDECEALQFLVQRYGSQIDPMAFMAALEHSNILDSFSEDAEAERFSEAFTRLLRCRNELKTLAKRQGAWIERF